MLGLSRTIQEDENTKRVVRMETVFQWLGYSREHYSSRDRAVSERILRTTVAIVHAVNTTKREIVHVYRKVRRVALVREHYLLNILRRGYRGAMNALNVLWTRLQETLARLMTFFVRLS